MGKNFQVHENIYPLDFNFKTFEYNPDSFRSKCRHTYIHTDILIQIPPQRLSSNMYTHTRTRIIQVSSPAAPTPGAAAW